MSSHTPPSPPTLDPDLGDLDLDLDLDLDALDLDAWPPPGSPPDEELQRLVKAKLFELMAEAGFTVTVPEHP